MLWLNLLAGTHGEERAVRSATFNGLLVILDPLLGYHKG